MVKCTGALALLNDTRRVSISVTSDQKEHVLCASATAQHIKCSAAPAAGPLRCPRPARADHPHLHPTRVAPRRRRRRWGGVSRRRPGRRAGRAGRCSWTRRWLRGGTGERGKAGRGIGARRAGGTESRAAVTVLGARTGLRRGGRGQGCGARKARTGEGHGVAGGRGARRTRRAQDGECWAGRNKKERGERGGPDRTGPART